MIWLVVYDKTTGVITHCVRTSNAHKTDKSILKANEAMLEVSEIVDDSKYRIVAGKVSRKNA